MPEQDEEFPAGMDCLVAGWGYTEDEGEISNTLHQAVVAIRTVEGLGSNHSILYSAHCANDIPLARASLGN